MLHSEGSSSTPQNTLEKGSECLAAVDHWDGRADPVWPHRLLFIQSGLKCQSIRTTSTDKLLKDFFIDSRSLYYCVHKRSVPWCL